MAEKKGLGELPEYGTKLESSLFEVLKADKPLVLWKLYDKLRRTIFS